MQRRISRFVWWVLLALSVPAAYSDSGTTSRTVVGTNPFLSEGATAIRLGSFEEGIRLTQQGLKLSASRRDKAAGLANMCGAYVGLREPDEAIPLCTESLEINNRSWKTYSNRAAAFAIKGKYSEALFDLDAAAAINPDARNVKLLRQILNEWRLRPKVIMEDHQPTSLFSE